jgi:ankyrin repeat protein
MKALLQEGARIDDRDFFGQTALMLAACHTTNPEIVQLLIEAGADTRAKDNEGKTAFDLAAANGALRGSAAYQALTRAAR